MEDQSASFGYSADFELASPEKCDSNDVDDVKALEAAFEAQEKQRREEALQSLRALQAPKTEVHGLDEGRLDTDRKATPISPVKVMTDKELQVYCQNNSLPGKAPLPDEVNSLDAQSSESSTPGVKIPLGSGNELVGVQRGEHGLALASITSYHMKQSDQLQDEVPQQVQVQGSSNSTSKVLQQQGDLSPQSSPTQEHAHYRRAPNIDGARNHPMVEEPPPAPPAQEEAASMERTRVGVKAQAPPITARQMTIEDQLHLVPRGGNLRFRLGLGLRLNLGCLPGASVSTAAERRLLTQAKPSLDPGGGLLGLRSGVMRATGPSPYSSHSHGGQGQQVPLRKASCRRPAPLVSAVALEACLGGMEGTKGLIDGGEGQGKKAYQTLGRKKEGQGKKAYQTLGRKKMQPLSGGFVGTLPESTISDGQENTIDACPAFFQEEWAGGGRRKSPLADTHSRGKGETDNREGKASKSGKWKAGARPPGSHGGGLDGEVDDDLRQRYDEQWLLFVSDFARVGIGGQGKGWTDKGHCPNLPGDSLPIDPRDLRLRRALVESMREILTDRTIVGLIRRSALTKYQEYYHKSGDKNH
ncbi:unnamed protein product [Discosporangium mesarthrocarpum]